MIILKDLRDNCLFQMGLSCLDSILWSHFGDNVVFSAPLIIALWVKINKIMPLTANC